MTYGRVDEKVELIPTLTDLIVRAKEVMALYPHDMGGDNRWAGGSLEDAERYGLYGWPEGSKMAYEIAASIADRVAATSGIAMQESIDYDVFGAAFDAGALNMGVPEVWARPELQKTRRAIRIVTNVSVSAGVPQSAMMQRGLAVAALVMVLQSQGYPVTVDVYQSISQSNMPGLLLRVADAETGSQLDIDRLVFVIAHPIVFRRLYRAYTAGHKSNPRPGNFWYWGSSMPLSDNRPEGEIDLFLGGQHLHQVERWQSNADAEEWVLSEFNRQTQEGYRE